MIKTPDTPVPIELQTTQTLSDAEFKKISAFMESHTGIKMPESKKISCFI